MMYKITIEAQYSGNFIWANGKFGQYMSIGLDKINQHLVIYYFFQRKNSFCYILKLILQSSLNLT